MTHRRTTLFALPGVVLIASAASAQVTTLLVDRLEEDFNNVIEMRNLNSRGTLFVEDRAWGANQFAARTNSPNVASRWFFMHENSAGRLFNGDVGDASRRLEVSYNSTNDGRPLLADFFTFDNPIPSGDPSPGPGDNNPGTQRTVRLGTEVGDRVVFSFDLQFVGTRTGLAFDAQNAATGLRFGIYNNNNTRPAGQSGGNFTTGFQDDAGLFGSFALAAEQGGSNIFQDLAGGVPGSFQQQGFGAPAITNLNATQTNSVNIGASDNALHPIRLEVAQLGGGLAQVSTFFDDSPAATVTWDFGAVGMTNVDFNQLMFWHWGANQTFGMTLDNIVLESIPIPEPATAGLLALAAGGLLVRRRR